MRDKEFEVWDVAVNEVYGLWHADGTGLLTQSADGYGFWGTAYHGVFFEVDDVERGTQRCCT